RARPLLRARLQRLLVLGARQFARRAPPRAVRGARIRCRGLREAPARARRRSRRRATRTKRSQAASCARHIARRSTAIGLPEGSGNTSIGTLSELGLFVATRYLDVEVNRSIFFKYRKSR